MSVYTLWTTISLLDSKYFKTRTSTLSEEPFEATVISSKRIRIRRNYTTITSNTGRVYHAETIAGALDKRRLDKAIMPALPIHLFRRETYSQAARNNGGRVALSGTALGFLIPIFIFFIIGPMYVFPIPDVPTSCRPASYSSKHAHISPHATEGSINADCGHLVYSFWSPEIEEQGD